MRSRAPHPPAPPGTATRNRESRTGSAMLDGMWPRLFIDPINWRLVAYAVIPTALIALAAARLARRAVNGALQGLLRDTVLPSSPLLRTPLRLIGATIFAVVFAALIFPAFEIAGLRPRTGVHVRDLSDWALDSGLKIMLIAAVAYALIRTVTIAVKRFEHDINFGTGLDALERAKRARTLGG